VFQEGRLLPHLTVRQNLLTETSSTGRRTTSWRSSSVTELLGIGTCWSDGPARFPAARAARRDRPRAALQPEVLLLDEPLASLDTPRKAEILYYIERLRDEVRVPIVYVSHSLDEVVRLADSVVLLSAGKVLASGSVRDLMSRVELRPTSAGSKAAP
jgi:molybdate transport system ATP-binding protein